MTSTQYEILIKNSIQMVYCPNNNVSEKCWTVKGDECNLYMRLKCKLTAIINENKQSAKKMNRLILRFVD